MRDCERDMVEPCLLAREIEVALDTEAASFIVSGQSQGQGVVSVRVSTRTRCLTSPDLLMSPTYPVIALISIFNLLSHLLGLAIQFLLHFYSSGLSCNHECANAEPRHFPRRNAT
jgi:hypothetical protein